MADLDDIIQILVGRTAVALTGAGISTESGIPDYRGPETARRARRPMRFADFVHGSDARARYWSRSMAGWPRVEAALPNAGHRALARLERHGLVRAAITQNVDRLHHKAGHQRVIELHGSLHQVGCLRCGHREHRGGLQQRLQRVNPGVHRGELNPDGDAEVAASVADRFRVLGCLQCGGDLKPDVVFFGESVPRSRVDAAYDQVERAGALLVVGTSLTVFSGYRFVKRAAERGLPIVIVNLGPTRADALATARLHAPAGEALTALADRWIATQPDHNAQTSAP